MRAKSHFESRRVIEPISFPEPHNFEQGDFHAFWSSIIAKAVTTMVQCKGWAFSTGCMWELEAALRKGCEVLDENFVVSSPHELVAAIEEASTFIDSPEWLDASRSTRRVLS